MSAKKREQLSRCGLKEAPVATPKDVRQSAVLGALIADAAAIPGHWYYDLQTLWTHYPESSWWKETTQSDITEWTYQAVDQSKRHPDSWKYYRKVHPEDYPYDIYGKSVSLYDAPGSHYHPFIPEGGVTLTAQVALALLRSLVESKGYDVVSYLRKYYPLLLSPDEHRDSYVEQAHRNFLKRYSQGMHPTECSTRTEACMGGVAQCVPLMAYGCESQNEGPDQWVPGKQHLELTHLAPDLARASTAVHHILKGLQGVSDFRERKAKANELIRQTLVELNPELDAEEIHDELDELLETTPNIKKDSLRFKRMSVLGPEWNR
eukprot:Clim_evm6s150 gene=Clim_evmTU6s150